MTFEIRNQNDIDRLEKELLADYLSIRPTPVLKQTITDLETLHDNYFQAETGPGGNRWAENAPSTKARKGHGDILQYTLTMRRAMTTTGAAGAVRDVFDEGHFAGLTFGLDPQEIPYWKYHDVPGGRLPWRPFIGITDVELTVIADRLLENQVDGLSALA